MMAFPPAPFALPFASTSSHRPVQPTPRPPKRSADAIDTALPPVKRPRETPPWDFGSLQLALVPHKPVIEAEPDADMDDVDEEWTLRIHPAALRAERSVPNSLPPSADAPSPLALVLYKPVKPPSEPEVEELDADDEDSEGTTASWASGGRLRSRRGANAATDVIEVIEPHSSSSPHTSPRIQAGLGAGSTSLTIEELPATVSSSSSSDAGVDDSMDID